MATQVIDASSLRKLTLPNQIEIRLPKPNRFTSKRIHEMDLWEVNQAIDTLTPGNCNALAALHARRRELQLALDECQRLTTQDGWEDIVAEELRKRILGCSPTADA